MGEKGVNNVTIQPFQEKSSVSPSLAENVTEAIESYLYELRGTKLAGLHQLVMDEIEAPLLKVVMEHCRYNQSRAATVLGLSRGTLRAKLKKYFDDKYTGNRD